MADSAPDEVEVIRAGGLAGIPHGFLGRRGGVSRGTIAGLNVGHGAQDDSEAVAEKLLHKILRLRIFSDEAGKMNRSVQDVGGGLLIVSQFTLAADTSGGNRPSFTGAAPAALGRRLYDHAVAFARSQHPVVETGEFGADMQVRLVNDGPVTIPMRM